MMESHSSVRPRNTVLEAAFFPEWRQIVKAKPAITHYLNRSLVMAVELTHKHSCGFSRILQTHAPN